MRALLFIFFVFVSTIASAQSSVLSSGSWYKFSVTADGVYKIDYSLLQKAGINPSTINPKNIRIYTGQAGMLPQPNSTPRVVDLNEMAINVVGESDGKFDAGDYILFYAQGADTYAYNTKSNFFNCQNNLFTDKNFYFLTVADAAGKRLLQSQNLSGSFPIINQFDDFAYYENDQYNLLNSGRQWFGEQFSQSLTLTLQFNIAGIVPNSPMKLTSHVMAQSITNCSFNVSFNNNAILTQSITAIPNTQYGVKGNVAIDTISFNESSANASAQSTQQIHYQFNKGTPGISIGYLDYIVFSMKRILALYDAQTFFLSSESTNHAASNFQINSVSSTNLIWDITNAFNVKNQNGQLNGNVFSFSTNTDTLKKFIVFDPTKVSKPTFESIVVNQNLHAISSADFLIISYAPLLAQANRLATFRQNNNGLNVVTATTDAIYNEYAGGKPDLTAIRDFVRDVYKKSNKQLKYVLLFGRGSYDYKDRVYNNTNFVPIYESYESLDPLGTYSSDDYFGFLEDNEGTWTENPAVNYSMDVGVGRIPAKNLTDAKAVVDKLIDYDTNPNRFGTWRKDFLFVADDGDADLHDSNADQLANNIEQNHSEFNAQKFFLDAYKQTNGPNGQISNDATKSLDLAIRKGKAIVNYTGHGSEQVWAQELLLTPDVIQSLNNAPMYPLFVTATCEFGRNDDPFIISSAELLLLQNQGGGIGLVTTARPVYSNTNFQLNQAFYQALSTKSNNAFRALGAIMQDTKNNSTNGTSNRNFSLLGDPSMKLAFANNQVVANSIQTLSGSDTIKALSQVSISGIVQGNGSTLSNYNGTVYATLHDKQQNLITLGDTNETITAPAPPYNYVARTNKLFEGSASVTQGTFQFDFTMPDNLVSGYDFGKLSLYSFSDNGNEAIGFSTSFDVGGAEPNPSTDIAPPEIKLYVSDTTFVNGGIVSANTQLYARLSDDSGINLSSINPQNNIIATLDNKWSYIVNDYFFLDKNNPKRGTVIYPLDTLKKGKHQLSLTASDVYNNSATTSINFIVAEGNGINIGDLGCYPNPVKINSDDITFYFTQTRAGEDLEATLIIYNLLGQPIAHLDYSITESTYQVNLGQWNGASVDGTKIGAGTYVARLSVRSLADNTQNQKAIKLIVLN